MLKTIICSLKRFVNRVKQYIKCWSKPVSIDIVVGSLSELKRSRRDLIVENAMLRQQLIVLNRQVKQAQFKPCDRLRLVLLARLTEFWKQALHIVQPDTLLRWHRDLFRGYWRRKSKPKKSEPRITAEMIALIKQMANENRLWGAERIRGELLKLGVKVSKRTIQKYMRTERHHQSGQTWATFLKSHIGDIWACDFTTTYDMLFQPLNIFVIMELHTRRIVHVAIVRTPSDAWTAQQLREATPWGKGPKYLIRDRDSKYGKQFAAAASGIQILKTPVQAPKANAFCERFMGSLKRECLDHKLVVSSKQLSRIVQQYVDYYNQSRPHQGIEQQIPVCLARESSSWPVGKPGAEIVSTPILGGLHHSYTRVAVSSH